MIIGLCNPKRKCIEEGLIYDTRRLQFFLQQINPISADCACTFIRALFLILKMGLMHVMNLNFPNELSENKKWFSQ